MKTILKKLERIFSDSNFLHFSNLFENAVAKVLSITLQALIFIIVLDLIVFLIVDVSSTRVGYFDKTKLIELFGLFLNILIALELLENITGYLKKHVVQVELVVITALIAIARKIIIFDLSKYSSNELMGLGVAIIALSTSYWLIKNINKQENK